MRYLQGQSDAFIGRRIRLNRYLVCPLQGYFPVLVRTGAQSLAVIFRTGALHMGLSATLSTALSWDGGVSWSAPVPVYPQWEDARNPAFGTGSRGQLIAAFWKADQAYRYTDGQAKWDAEHLKHGDFTFCCRSFDGGRNWGDMTAVRCPEITIVSPFGRIVRAADDTLLMNVYGPHWKTNIDSAYVIRSRDDGVTWEDYTRIDEGINESALCFAPDGSLVAAARTLDGAVCMYYSGDGGYSWQKGERVTRPGEHPADLALLASGRMIMVFGRRVRPMGCGAYISSDNGRTWDREHELLLAGDGVSNGDLGYPSVAVLEDGQVVTALYYASGSEMSGEWGDISCQAIVFNEKDML